MSSSTTPGVTRGSGFLEAFLAKKRAVMANKLIEEPHRSGRILDLGCGTTPFFLMNTRFGEKVGVEKRPAHVPDSTDVKTYVHDIELDTPLPFEESSFDVVTMLAVFEHLKPARLPGLLDEIYRVLRPHGVLILTTPASWTDPILATMSKLGLVSHEEIEEHQQTYTHSSIKDLFAKSRFGTQDLELGYFELFMNMWAKARKA